jgi:DNA-binding transcriptional ArsR family regulator
MASNRLSLLQHRILAWLAAEEQRTRGTMAASHPDLVRALATDKSNLSRSLMRLEDQGLVTIARTPGGKAEAVALTRRGKQVVHKPEVVLPKPLKRWRRLTGERWHARLVEVRRYIADLQRAGLFERLAETWKPEIQAGYHRELLHLVGQLTTIAQRLESVMQQDASEPRAQGLDADARKSPC